MDGKNFGLERVIEPKNNTPVTAWKLDNSKKVKSGEIRIRVKRVVFERENLGQLCSICEFDRDRIIGRILKIVEERGKLHNPYTESSGLIEGYIEDASKDYDLAGKGLAIGDEVICLAPMAAIPLHLDKIKTIDFFYSVLECEGYGICFDRTPLMKVGKMKASHIVHLLRALEEEGNFCGMADVLRERRNNRAIIIGNNIAETILYAQLLHKLNPHRVSVGFACDSAYEHTFSKADLKGIFGNLIQEIFFVSLSDPVEAANKILNEGKSIPIDTVINMENIKGSESVSPLIVREHGLVVYTNMLNRYTTGLLVSDSLGKDIMNYALDGFQSSTFPFALELIKEARSALERLDEYNKIRRKENPKIPIVRMNHIDTVAQNIDDFAFMSPVTANMVEEVINVAQYECSVIIQGETGVGKEKVFNLLHQHSLRKDKPCVKINCATIQENLAESEFFGYEKGAFTGAHTSGKEGYFEIANNGTLFLDEIGALSLNMQSKLLRVLQENSYYKVGGTSPKHVNVRVICANNIPLRKLVDEGKFREDLYYRLNICQINVPPLRMRKTDITYLAEVFMENYSKKYGKTKMFSPGAYKQLEEYHWPGNVRELENVVHRLYISEKEDVIDDYAVDVLLNDNVFEETLLDIRKEFKRDESMDFIQIMEKQERRLIEYALKKERTTRKAAEFLGIPQTTLARKKLKHNL